MKYRALGDTGIKVSEIGLGCEHLQGQSAGDVYNVIDRAGSYGFNLLDVFMSEPQVRTDIGLAIKGRRDQFVIQGHIGAIWRDGQYERTRDIDLCKRFIDDFLQRLGTDYIDVGMLHFVDTQDDYDAVFNGEAVKYARSLKEQGVIRAVGMSSHDPVASLRAVESGLIDALMFSINPAYDLLNENTPIDDLFDPETYGGAPAGINPVREKLYRRCEAGGVGITVMKSMGGGALISQKSPFGKAMTPSQCFHYCLTRPGVASVLAGCRNVDEVDAAAAYVTATAEERDYSPFLARAQLFSMQGKCVYCNHCLPCPSHIDIAAVNKYADLAEGTGEIPGTARAHYMALPAHAGDCIACGACESNCPFEVPVIERMEKAKRLFGV